jgi:hypothetical protein
MAGVQIHDAINPKDDQPRTPMQCWCAQSNAHTAPCGLSLLPGTERQSLLPGAKHPAAPFQSSMGLAAGTHQRVHGGSGPVVGPRCRGHEGAGAGSPALSAALAALYPSQRPWRTQICSTARAGLPPSPSLRPQDGCRAYYASIDHQLLLDRLAVHIADRQILLSSGSISGVVRSGVAYSGTTRKASRWAARSVRFWGRFS